ncbi:PspA-associated protein PspAB [Calderihabitans maritimus]|uniref:Uncharacterized protein n=1 Tax=Calderihabitans maritimus TaxID=1246530 RepID=A0A1Z5HSB6_9FIRM|nr:hypothetical protein [Calderihabitans maritimus]GAW92328.1 hypothetical protein Moth_0715 [Calderihabitans maritimus]
MGWWDVLFGRSRLKKPQKDALFSLSTAEVSFEAHLGWIPAGRAGICLKPTSGADYARTEQDVIRLLESAAADFGSKVTVTRDKYNFLWLIIQDQDFEDLISLSHLVAQTLDEEGYGGQLLAVVFRFTDHRPEQEDKAYYLIYSYKRGLFYPFVPSGTEARDNSLEMRVFGVMEKELPMEADTSRWYPLWNCPV